MDTRVIELINKLKVATFEENFIDVSQEVTEELENRSDAFEAVEPILRIMERNPNVDYGRPGPFVHFVEKFYKNGYEEKLVESLSRKPTKHTVWMLNRIINGSHDDKKGYYIGVLEKVIAFPNLDADIISLAQHFQSLHMRNKGML